jgi:cbb3-type cytochrome c oxidase subunit III
MMRILLSLVLLPSLLLTVASHADQALYQLCASCHGAQAEGGVTDGSPGLNHLSAWYIERQLNNYRQGIRGDEDDYARTMKPMAATLADATAVTAMANYIAGLPKTPVKASYQGNISNGENYFNQKCGACHGTAAVGNKALNAPNLVGLGGDYVYRQLSNFKSKKRGMHPDDKFAKPMVFMAASLPNEQAVVDVVSYIESLAQ